MNKNSRSYRQDSPTRRRNLLMIVLDVVTVVLTIVLSFSLMLSYLACYVNPSKLGFIYYVGLGGQLLLFANFLMTLYWTLRWRRWAFVSALALLLGVGFWGDFLQLTLSKEYPYKSDDTKNEIQVMSYNVHNFDLYKTPLGSHFTGDSIFADAHKMGVDVLCLQEYTFKKKDSAMLADMVDRMGYAAFDNSFMPSSHLAILSKYPLLNVHRVRLEEGYNFAMIADMVCNKDTVRVFNCHLQSTQYNVVNPGGVQAIIHENDDQQIIDKIGESLGRNSIIRAHQADTLALLIEQSPYPVIVVGDFNSPVLSYTYHKIRGELKDSFSAAGRGYQYTYKRLGRLFRIDYILFDESMECLRQESPDLKWSDHKPVKARFKINPIRR